MVDRPGPSIVNIASAAGHLGGTAYGVKLVVAGLTVTFAAELGPKGVRVNAISPGLILTDTIRAEADIVDAMLYPTTAGSATTVADPAPKAVGIAIAGNTPIRPTAASRKNLDRVLPDSPRPVITSPHSHRRAIH
jgi:NAD(P)-dependent dehydrogenase (short-subunit alcohol dehydrogenase family)